MMTLAMEYNHRGNIVQIYKDEFYLSWWLRVRGFKDSLTLCASCEQAIDLFDETVERLRMEVN